MSDEPIYELIYWPHIPGRGEFVRLALEEAGAHYTDVARLPEQSGGGIPAVLEFVQGKNAGHPVFAPPVLRHGSFVLAQTPAILGYLGPRHGLWPTDPQGGFHAWQLLVQIADLVAEVHDTHHPVDHGGHYEDQKPEAARRADRFVKARLPRMIGHLEDVLSVNGGEVMVGEAVTVVDLAVFHLLDGLDYAFPRAMDSLTETTSKLRHLAERVRTRPRVAAYLASERRIPFNQQGVFRRYPELDGSSD